MLSQLYWCSSSGLCGVGSHNWEPNADNCSWWLFLSHSVQEQAAEAKQIIFSFYHPQYLAVLYGLLYANVFSHSGFESRGLMGGTKRFSVSSETVPCFRTDRGKGSSVVFRGGIQGPRSPYWGAEEHVCTELERCFSVEYTYRPIIQNGFAQRVLHTLQNPTPACEFNFPVGITF